MTDWVSALDVGLSGSLSVIAFSRGGPDACFPASDMLLYTWFATFSCQMRISLSGFIGRASWGRKLGNSLPLAELTSLRRLTAV